jgi:hypothetical protein
MSHYLAKLPNSEPNPSRRSYARVSSVGDLCEWRCFFLFEGLGTNGEESCSTLGAATPDQVVVVRARKKAESRGRPRGEPPAFGIRNKHNKARTCSGIFNLVVPERTELSCTLLRHSKMLPLGPGQYSGLSNREGTSDLASTRA